MTVVASAEEDGAKHHGQRAESSNAGGEVGLFVNGKTQFQEMQYAVAIK